MVPIISIVGYSDAGKTTLVEKLVPELRKKGHRVGTVKHSDHEPEFDKEGKDSWRHFNAGADAVVVASSEKVAIIRKNESRLKDSHAQLSFLSNYLTDMDVIIAEGYKHSKYPKIEVYRSVTNETPLCKNNITIAAIVTDADIQVDLPRFGLNEIEKISDFIEDNFL
jgi:molybdopterin-guanine dinucleotide biosynthesis protein B